MNLSVCLQSWLIEFDISLIFTKDKINKVEFGVKNIFSDTCFIIIIFCWPSTKRIPNGMVGTPTK